MDFLSPLLACFTEYGYLAVFSVLMLCGFGIPIPEDVSLVAGGIIAGLGYANPHLMVLVGLAGVLGGDALIFFIGRHYGNRVLAYGPVSRFMTPDRVDAVERKFTHYGKRMMFMARFLPGMRTAIFLCAGMCGKVSAKRFFFSDGLAALLSVPFWVYLGYAGASNRDWLLMWMHRGQLSILSVVGVIIALLCCYSLVKRIKRSKSCICK
ncbi:DedA family protein [Burkholderiaceae bacterium DAT-1]|nr:DedA family protein [Burkholderiaceae bacterium DAT-1]